jgi:prolyl-tRNA synthetase
VKRTAEDLYAQLRSKGIEVLFDDRDERPGVKFKDADLIGVPFRVVVGKKLASGLVELVERKTKQSTDVAIADAAGAVAQRLANAG